MDTHKQPKLVFSDNILVKRNKWGCDYFDVSFWENPDEYIPYEVSLSRYCVPGRCDYYHFDYVSGKPGCGDRVRYFSEGREPLLKNLTLLHKDLDKPQVVELIKIACEKPELRYHTRIFTNFLLAILAPKSKSYKTAQRVRRTMIAKKLKFKGTK